MKELLVIATLIVCLTASYGFAQTHEGMMSSGDMMESQQQAEETPQSDWYYPCPHMMGPGMMGGMMGPGMMRQGMRGGMMGRGYARQQMPQYQQQQKPLEEEDAKAMIEDYLKATRNPNLKLGAIKEISVGFEVEILTKNNSLVDKIFVDKNTGWMRSIY